MMRARLQDINPNVKIVARHQFLDPQSAKDLATQPCDFIVDCIDSIAPKVRPSGSRIYRESSSIQNYFLGLG